MMKNNYTISENITPTKLGILKSNVVSVLLYGCETWKATQEIIKKLQTLVSGYLHNILRMWWPKTVSNKELWKKM
jgi:predicted ThiF/HesA family dinucleotide-utilizing enzyme